MNYIIIIGTIANLVTILAFVLGLKQYKHYMDDKKLENKIILENLRNEIEQNNLWINRIKTKEMEHLNYVIIRLDYKYLEKSTFLIKDSKVRERIITLVIRIRNFNIGFDNKFMNKENFLIFEEKLIEDNEFILNFIFKELI